MIALLSHRMVLACFSTYPGVRTETEAKQPVPG